MIQYLPHQSKEVHRLILTIYVNGNTVVFDLSVAKAEFFHLEKEKRFIHIVKCIGVKTSTEISVFIKSQHHLLKT